MIIVGNCKVVVITSKGHVMGALYHANGGPLSILLSSFPLVAFVTADNDAEDFSHCIMGFLHVSSLHPTSIY